MSVKLVETAIREFLSSLQPEVICLSGQWGVGKTFAWNRYLREAQAEHKIALKRYSYVSLFGIDSLAELKYSIFENSVKSSAIDIEPSLETLRSNTGAIADRLGRKSMWFMQQLPYLKNHVGGLGPLWFLSVQETIVCIDDLERRGKNLSVRDVLGLVSSLKEQKKCKAVLILNNEALEDKAEFQRYYEKVVDTSLRFDPSAEESVQIALREDTKAIKLLAANCIAFGISNIRVIKKIERSVRIVERIVAEFHEQVLMQAVQSLTLLGWSIYEPIAAPPLDYLLKKGTEYLNVDKEKSISKEEAAWNALLSSSGFTGIDDFDMSLLNGIENGFFDKSLIRNSATKLDQKIRATELDRSFYDAWDLYHDSFDNNQDEVLNTMYQSFFKSVQYISPMNMNSTIALFKALGRENQAEEMIKHYVESRDSEREIFNLRSYPFAGDVTDPDVIRAFDAKYATFKATKSPKEILLTMITMNGWNPEDIATLATAPVEEYYQIFKSSRGKEKRNIVNTCLQFDRIGNSTKEMTEISTRAKEALKRIGEESAINAKRVKAYGIVISGPPSKETPEA